MGLEELTFDVEGVKIYLKSELHKYHDSPDDDSFLGSVPVRVEYPIDYNFAKHQDIVHEEEGSLTYDLDKRIFITALSDFVPTNPKDIELLEKYAKGMAEVGRVYTAIRQLMILPIITEKHFYQNSQGEWKDIGDWLGVYTEKELLDMADAVK